VRIGDNALSLDEGAMSENSSQFMQGMKQGFPVIIAAAPFGMLFGTLAIENGLTISEAVFMSAIVFAGASQMVGIELFGQDIAPWLILLSIFAVNFRHVLYSATLGRYFEHMPKSHQALAFFFMTDPQFASSEQRGESGTKVTLAWYMGMALPLYASWVVEAWIGAVFGSLITNTEALGITFLLSIYFLALLMSFRGRSLFTPVVATIALTSSIAYLTLGSPWHVSVGAVFGILVAACWPARYRKVPKS
jgi:4-azaleucine resistance transporter AzlC